MVGRFSPQSRAGGGKRITDEAGLDLKKLGRRLTALETANESTDAHKVWIRDELMPWLADLATFVGYGTPPPEPPS